MADPTKYIPSYSYSGYQASSPTRPLPGQRVDNDFANASRSINETIDALKDIRRSDGKLQNGIVTPSSLSPTFSIGFTFRGTWLEGSVYDAGDGVVHENIFYAASVSNVANPANEPGVDGTWDVLFSLEDILVAGALSMPNASFTGDGEERTFTLPFVPLSASNLLVIVGGVIQAVSEYTVNGDVLTMNVAPPDGVSVQVRGFATTATLVVPEDGSVGTPKLADGAVTRQKLADGSVSIAKFAKGLVPFDTFADFSAAQIDPEVNNIWVLGYVTVGDGGGHFRKRMPAPSTVRPWHAQSADGSWWHLTEDKPNPIMFGARRGAADGSFTYDSGQALTDFLEYVASVTAYGEILSGFYLTSQPFNPKSGCLIVGLGTNEAWELPFFNVDAMTIDRGVTLAFIGEGPKQHVLDFCSAMDYNGMNRLNTNRLYNNVHDAKFGGTDFTMADAVGITRASLRPFSAMLALGLDGLSGKQIVRNIRFVVTADDGVNGPMAGYLAVNANTFVQPAKWDVGEYNLNPYTAASEDCQFAGYLWMKGRVQSPIRFGNTVSGGRGEMAISERNWYQCGECIANGDPYPILSKTANSFTVPWNKGHRFQNPGVAGAPTTVSITTDVGVFTYGVGGIAYSAAGEGTLTFTVNESTANIVVSGETRSFIITTNNNGTSQSSLRNCNVRDLYHPSGLERPNIAFFGAYAGPYSATREVRGYPIREVAWERCTVYDTGGFSLFWQCGRDCSMSRGTWEHKTYRTTVGGPANPGGKPMGLFIAGPDAAHLAQTPMFLRGALTVDGYSLGGDMNMRGEVSQAAPSGRYGAMTDVCNLFFFRQSNHPAIDHDIFFDASGEDRYFLDAATGAAIYAYDRIFQIDTFGGAATGELARIIPASPGLDEAIFSTFNSGRDVLLKHQAGGDYQLYLTAGTDTWLFSPINPVYFVLFGKTWYQLDIDPQSYLVGRNYASDAAAATGGVPVGQLYHNAGAVRVRLV